MAETRAAQRPPTPPGQPPSDVSRQIAELTDAVNRLVRAQQTQSPAPAPAPVVSGSDISGEIQGGSPLTPSVDVSKLSPLQQITLGLRDAKPVVRRTVPGSCMRKRRTTDADDGSPAGAD